MVKPDIEVVEADPTAIKFEGETKDENISTHDCNDCGVNVIKIGEYYMLSPEIWSDRLNLTWCDNLCIGCVEKRLGRKLTMRDFGSFPANPRGFATSTRYLERMNYFKKRNPR